ncbi:MAG: tetratricopeptide repeat protein [Myxococcaceae bacterium]
MKKRILAACVAALSLAACNEPPVQQKPVAAAPKAKPTPVPIAENTPVPSFIADAGAMTQVEARPTEPDPLGVAHEHRGKADHLGRARQMKTEGDFAGALAEARRAVFDNPADEEALAMTARFARQTGAKELAAQAYGRLGELRPDDAMPLIAHARVLIALRDFEGAVMVGSEALIRDGQNPEGFQVVGLAYLSAGELKDAISHFEKVIALSPDHGWAQNNLGFALLRANQYERAVEVLTRAAELLPNAATVHNNLGVALERTGQMDEAKLAYGRSTSLSPKYVKAKVNSARVAKAPVTPEVMPEEPIAPEVELPEE